MEHNLTIEERQKFWQSLDKMDSASHKIEKLYLAVVGDTELKQEGILSRLEKVEFQLEQMDKMIEKTKGWVAGALAVGSLAGSVLTLVIKSIFKL